MKMERKEVADKGAGLEEGGEAIQQIGILQRDFANCSVLHGGTPTVRSKEREGERERVS